jgi:hypothetical protein
MGDTRSVAKKYRRSTRAKAYLRNFFMQSCYFMELKINQKKLNTAIKHIYLSISYIPAASLYSVYGSLTVL